MLTLLADINKYTWVSTLIEFEGLEELLKSIEGLADTQKVEQGISKACLLVERAARENASIDKGTGELARSITSEARGLTGEVYTPLEYAPYREYGTGLYAENGNGRQDVPCAHLGQIHPGRGDGKDRIVWRKSLWLCVQKDQLCCGWRKRRLQGAKSPGTGHSHPLGRRFSRHDPIK